MSATAVPVEPDDDQGAGAIGLPVFMMTLLFGLLVLPDQIKELYRVHAEAWAEQRWYNPQLVLAAASLAVLTFFIWRLARELSRLPAAQRIIPDHWSRLVFDWMPRLICLVPWMAVGIGAWLSAVSLPQFYRPTTPEFDAIYPELDRVRHFLTLGAVTCGAIAAALFVIITAIELIFGRWGKHLFGRPFLLRLWPVYLAIVLGMSAASLFLDGSWFVEAGIIPVVALWTIGVTGLLAHLWHFSERVRSAVLAALVFSLITFDYYGWTDNHRFRHAPVDFPWQAQDRPKAQDAFDQWLAARKDMETFRQAGAPYPVYVVAAEGGGLYAAYHVGKFLARMQDLCPSFSQHLFAISAVSGGSLGAAMFASLARDDAKNQQNVPCRSVREGRFERRMERLLTRDFLSPVVAATFFHDFVQRFVPFPVHQLDRARKLEASFESAWAKTFADRPNRLAESFVGSCGTNAQDCLQGAAPVLVLNLTQVETGVQLALSPINLNDTGPPDTKSGKIYDALENGGQAIDMPMSTAIGLSARFPWVTPSGWYSQQVERDGPDGGKIKELRTYRFADGGYAEGSGAGTGYKIAQLVAERITASGVNAYVHFIMLTATSPPLERFFIEPHSSAGYGEFALPFVALNSARRGQAFTRVYDIAVGATDQLKISPGQIYDNLIPLAVGWHLSEATRKYIDLYTGKPENCGPPPKPEDIVGREETMAASYVYKHDCLTKTLVDELSPQPKQ